MTSKPLTIPDEHEALATLSYWLRCYPWMALRPKAWGLQRAPVSERCKALYPDIVNALHAESRPMVVNFAVAGEEAIAA